MARTNTRGKRRIKKNIAKGVAHVHSTFNNTIVTVTDEHGNTSCNFYKTFFSR